MSTRPLHPASCPNVEVITIKNSFLLVNVSPISFFLRNPLIEFIYEPEEIKILDTLCPRHLHVKIWRVLLESYASEMGARMTTMEYATENANNIINELTMEYNKVRQEKITGEILEIVSGSEALRSS